MLHRCGSSIAATENHTHHSATGWRKVSTENLEHHQPERGCFRAVIAAIEKRVEKGRTGGKADPAYIGRDAKLSQQPISLSATDQSFF